MGRARDFFAGEATIVEPDGAASTRTADAPLGGAAGGGTLPLAAPLGLEPVPEPLPGEPTAIPAAMASGLDDAPPLLFLCNRFRSARSSAADWQRRSRSFSSVLLSVSS